MSKIKKRNLFIISILMGLVIIFSLVRSRIDDKKEPTIYLTSDAKLKAMSNEEFYIDVKLSSFPKDSVFPAASFLITFDQTKVQFTGLKLGTMPTGDEAGKKESLSIPVWKSNTDVANETGTISAIYLDMSASNHSYRDYCFASHDKDILVRLNFTLLDSAQAGDKLTFTFQDAVLAAVKESGNSSIAMTDETLKIKDLTLDIH